MKRLLLVAALLCLAGTAVAQVGQTYWPPLGKSPPIPLDSCTTTSGTKTHIGGYVQWTFLASDTLVCPSGFTGQLLAIAGGGSGSNAGGGAGGYCTSGPSPTCGLGASVTFPSGSTAITVGAGGAPGTNSQTAPGNAGGNTVVGSIVTAIGGSGGGMLNTAAPGSAAGGSTGGCGPNQFNTCTAAGAASQGNSGGNIPTGFSGGLIPAAAGGGAGQAGNSPGGTSLDGGNGLTSSVSGSPAAYAGGGAGATQQGAGGLSYPGGLGGGGASAGNANGGDGTPNTGGGGAGGDGFTELGGSGGSGIVIICAPVNCGGIPVPVLAFAVGYNTNTFNTPSFSTANTDLSGTYASGFQWYLYNFFGETPTAANISITAGAISVGQGDNTFNVALGSAGFISASPNFVGTAFGGGAYIQAVIKFDPTAYGGPNGWPAFWTYALEGNLGTSQWPGQAPGYQHFIETDIMEYFEGQFSESLDIYAASFHDWYGGGQVGPGTNFGVGQANFANYNTVAMLWVPATVSVDGYVNYYWNGNLVSSTSYTQIPNGAVPPPTAPWIISIIDQDHLVIQMGSNSLHPIVVQSVQVWQANASSNMVH